MTKIYPSLEQLLSCTHIVSIPLITKFRGVHFREAAIISGPKRWAEFSPFLEYTDLESAKWLQAALETAWEDYPKIYRTKIPINATIPAVPAGQVEHILNRFPACETVKIKVAEVGQHLEHDVKRVQQVRKKLPNAKIRVDANGGWSTREAEIAIKKLYQFGLEYVEQPVSSITEMANLRKKLRKDNVAVLIAADESIRKSADPLQVEKMGAADVVVLKVPPLGGVTKALKIAKNISLPVVVSSCLDTSIGVNMGLVLAAALPKLDYACGLGTVSLLTADVTVQPLTPVAGYLHLREIAADKSLLETYQAQKQRVKWWYARIARVYNHLPALEV